MTQKAQHTPGPWGVSLAGNIVCKKTTALIAKISRPSTPAKVANARLIAAAPDLLEALKPFAKAHQTWIGGNAREHFSLAVTPADYLRALKAVAKVELAA